MTKTATQAELERVPALELEVDRLKADRDQLVDALDHIRRTCLGSRTQTRRIRWLALRAKCAIDGNDEWKVSDVPVNDPLIETLRAAIEMIYPVAERELDALLESYESATCGDDIDERIGSIEEEDVREDCRVLVNFLAEARRNVPALFRSHRERLEQQARETGNG